MLRMLSNAGNAKEALQINFVVRDVNKKGTYKLDKNKPRNCKILAGHRALDEFNYSSKICNRYIHT